MAYNPIDKNKVKTTPTKGGYNPIGGKREKIKKQRETAQRREAIRELNKTFAWNWDYRDSSLPEVEKDKTRERAFGEKTFGLEIGEGIQPPEIGGTKTPKTTEKDTSDIPVLGQIYSAGEALTETAANVIGPTSYLTSEIVKAVGQGMAREVGALEAAYFEPKIEQARKGEFINPWKVDFEAKIEPKTEWQKKLYGTDKPFSVGDVGGEMLDLVGQVFGEETQDDLKFLRVPLGLIFGGLTLADASPRTITSVSKAISKTDDVFEISNQIKRAVRGTEEEIQTLADGLRKTTDEKAIERVLRSVNKKKPDVATVSKMEAAGMTKDDVLNFISKSNKQTDEMIKAFGKVPAKKTTKRTIKETTGPNPFNLISKPEINLLKERIRNVARGSRIGKAAAKQEIKNLQADITDVIKKNLPVARRGKHLSKIKDVQSPATLKKQLDNVVRDIRDYEIEEGIKRVKGVKRKKIAYARLIGDFNQTAVNDAKDTIGVKKPISKMDDSELESLLQEMKNRLQFKEQRGYQLNKPREKVKLSENFYNNAVNAKIKPRRAEKAKKAFGKAGKSAEEFAGILTTRLKNVHPSLKRAMREFEYNIRKVSKRDERQVQEFLEEIIPRRKKGFSQEDYIKFDLAAKNGDMDKQLELARKYGLEEKYNKVRKVLDDLHARAEETGWEIGYAEGYFPRVVKDSEGLLRYLQKGDNWGIIERAIRSREQKIGRSLNVDERAEMINTLLRGYNIEGISLSKTGAMKSRVIDTIDSEINQFYHDTPEALMMYIRKQNEAIEARRFFGKVRQTDPGMIEKKTAEFNDLPGSAGALVNDLLQKGEIDFEQAEEVRRLFDARFNEKPMAGIVSDFKNLGYMSVLGNFINAVTQTADIGFMAAYTNGLGRTVTGLPKVVFNRAEIKMADLNIDEIMAEMSGGKKTQRALHQTLKWSGFEKLDRVGKESLVNGYFQRLKKQAKDGSINDELIEVFGTEANQVKKDLLNGVISDDVKYMLFYKLTDMQPITLSEVPEKYLTSGNGRIFYQMKTWQLKMYDIFRNEAFSKMKKWRTDKKEAAKGFKNLIHLGGLLVLSGATADMAKDFIMGREIDLSDEVYENMIQFFGVNSYALGEAEEEGLFTGIAKTLFFPPAQWLDRPAKDMWSIYQAYKDPEESFKVNELRTPGSIPVAGKLYYWWFGRGAKYKEEQRKKELKKTVPAIYETREDTGGEMSEEEVNYILSNQE